MEKRVVFSIVFAFVFACSFALAAAPENSFHLNIQTINSTDDIINGTFKFEFNISVSEDCANIIYSNYSTLTTDSRGIISYYLDNMNLNFSEQYWLCYYRDGTLINSSKIAKSPYSFRSFNITLSGIKADSNFDMANYNLTTTGSGFFTYLGSLVSRITLLFVQDIDFSGKINGSGAINTTGNVTADTFFGNWNGSSLLGELYAPNTTAGIQYLINDTNLALGNVDFNSGWTSGGASIIEGNLFAQTIYVYNISSLSVSNLFINGSSIPSLDNQFDLGNTTFRWKNLYLSGDIHSNGTLLINNGIDVALFNDTALILSINTTAGIQGLVNSTYIPYIGSSQAVQLGNHNFSVGGSLIMDMKTGAQRLGIGTLYPQARLHVHIDDVYGIPSLTGVDMLLSDTSTYEDSAVFALIGGANGSSNIQFGDFNDSNAGEILYDHEGNSFNFTTNGTANRMILDQFGDLYVGNLLVNNLGTINSTKNIQELLNSTGIYNQAGGINYWGSNGSNIYNETALIGIGTASPAYPLEIIHAGNSGFRMFQTGVGGLLFNYGGFNIQGLSSTGLNSDLALNRYGGEVGIGMATPVYLLEVAMNAKALNVSGFLYANSSSVGIGTFTPSQALDVRGQGNFSGTIYINNVTDVSTLGGINNLTASQIANLSTGQLNWTYSLIANNSISQKFLINNLTASQIANLSISQISITGVTAGDGLTGGGSSGSVTLDIVSNAGSAGSIGTINIGANAIGVDLGTTSITAYRGDLGNTAYSERRQWDGGSTNLVASTGRTSLGLVAGGAGDIWVEKGGDTMTGGLTIEDGLVVNAGNLSVLGTGNISNTLHAGSGTASSTFNSIGSAAGMDDGLNANNDLYIGGELEVDGSMYLTGGYASITQSDVAEMLQTIRGRQNTICEEQKAVGKTGCVINSTEDLHYGDVVCIDPRYGQVIMLCNQTNSRLVAGVVSNTSVINMGNNPKHAYPIAVAGIVWTKVSNENGPINPGDFLVSASKEGYAMKNNDAKVGTVLGKAFDYCDYRHKECIIPMFVSLG